jgi:hypothetical protein
MSGVNNLTIAVSSPGSPDTVFKEELIRSTESAFFDGMLTFGWLSDRAMRVIEVNDALRGWLTVTKATDLLEKIDQDGVDVQEFLKRILHDDHEAVAGKVKGNLEWITREIEGLNYDLVREGVQRPLVEDKPEDLYTVQRTIRFVNDKVLAGVRVVAPGAIRLRSINERDRVDLVSACQVVREDNHWRVVGYQGLLQQAWLRVKANIKAGTQAGTVGLVSRNMSHNIGSHALFYLELDEVDEKKKVFFRYMRERMELLAGFATSMPLSSAPGRLAAVIGEFQKNQALLTRIAKSEQVEEIKVIFEDEDREVALPGGALSAQALYSIFENNIRDSAKHGRTKYSQQTEVHLKIRAREPDKPEFREDFIELVVSDNRRNFSDAGERLKRSLDNLRIVDEMGRLEPGDWGIKERFISAALLRGRRLEDIDIQLPGDRERSVKYFIGDYAPEGEPRILTVKNVDGNIGWVFYLLKPKDILLIGNPKPEVKQSLEEKFHDVINIQPYSWLQDNITLPSKVRHRFLLVYPENQSQLDDLETQRDRLPYRVIVCLPKDLELNKSSRFASILADDFDLPNLSLDRLYQLWVNWLLDYPPRTFWQKTFRRMRFTKQPRMPEILIRDAGLKALVLDEDTGQFHWKLDSNKDYKTDSQVILLDRHGSCVQNKASRKGAHDARLEWNANGKRFASTITHYEPYMQGDALSRYVQLVFDQSNTFDKPLDPSTMGFSFLEAGLTKILIVDERLDPATEQMTYRPDHAKWECSYKELFQKKGIDIKGLEYASDKIPGSETLVDWVNDKNYDFLVLHKGIVDKLIKMNPGVPPKDAMKKLFELLREHVRHIVIHSGRMAAGELPEGVKFMSLSNVDTWLKGNRAKTQIVEDLYLLRRP